jgi:hypothetical protein
MIRIVHQTSVLVEEHGLSFVKGDAVLSQVGSGLLRIPAKPDIAHSIILAILVRVSFTPEHSLGLARSES